MRTWLTRTGLGIALLAALALGRVITDAWPTEAKPEQPFVRSGTVGPAVTLRYADVRVDKVDATRVIATTGAQAKTTGVWLVLDLTVTVHREPLAEPLYLTVVDADGRTFEPVRRAGYSLGEPLVGVPWHLRVPVELPRGDLVGTALRVAPDSVDDRRDDVGLIALGIDRAAAARLQQRTAPIAVTGGNAGALPSMAAAGGAP